MENLLFTIKKAPLIAWKAFLVLWALFLGFIGLVIKLLKFMSQFNPDGTSAMNKSSSDDGFTSEKKPDWRYNYPTERDNYKPYQ